MMSCRIVKNNFFYRWNIWLILTFVSSIPHPDSLPDRDADGLPLYDVAHDAFVTLDPTFGMGKTST